MTSKKNEIRVIENLELKNVSGGFPFFIRVALVGGFVGGTVGFVNKKS